MVYEKTVLHPFEDASLLSICITKTDRTHARPRRAVIVCPGGAYSGLAPHEAEPIAFRFLAAGFATFILSYSLKEKAADFAPLSEVALAIRHVREHAAEYNVDPDYVFTCGFSAGGHLACSAGVLWDHPRVRALMEDAPEGINRPTGMILCYPVISADPSFGHLGSIRRVCGKENPTKEEADVFSLEKHVNATTSPAFLWHTFADKGVPVENSLVMAAALRRAGVPFELHVFPEGGHGLGLCDGTYGAPSPHNACWMELAIRWVKDFTLPEKSREN